MFVCLVKHHFKGISVTNNGWPVIPTMFLVIMTTTNPLSARTCRFLNFRQRWRGHFWPRWWPTAQAGSRTYDYQTGSLAVNKLSHENTRNSYKFAHIFGMSHLTSPLMMFCSSLPTGLTLLHNTVFSKERKYHLLTVRLSKCDGKTDRWTDWHQESNR